MKFFPERDRVKVVIPVYKTVLSPFEYISLRQTFQVLSKYTIVLICPYSLDIKSITDVAVYGNKIEIERFDDYFFKGIKEYNELMLSDLFYKRFLNTEYILICQTDVYVFFDQLHKWIEKKYDYIGAPWIASKQHWYSSFLRDLDNILRQIKGKKKRNWEHLFKVGNGGFSLRKVDKFYQIAADHKVLIEELKKNVNSKYWVEDVFWSLKAPCLHPAFSIPDYKEAVSFAIDRKPEIAIKLNHNALPFACHGFNKPKVRKFWERYINIGDR